MADALEIIAEHASEGVALREKFFAAAAATLDDAAFATALSLARGGKVLLCGNGGSAADAQHVAAEFVNRFLFERPGLPAIALTTDTSAITAIGNDRSFDQVFARQLEALARPGDVLVGISTSGSSADVVAAIDAARQRQMVVIGFTGAGGKMSALCDYLLAVPDTRTPLIQEVHLAAEHLLCRLVDWYLFEKPERIAKALESTPGEG